MDTITLVGNAATFCTVASNLAGLPVCLGFLKKKSTIGVSFLPFLAAVINSSLWLQYGVAVGDSVVAIVGVISLIIQAGYLACYYFSSVVKNDIQKSCIVTAVLLSSIHMVTFHWADKSTGTLALGYLAGAGSILSSASPLPTVGQVIRSKNTEGLPFPIILAGFIVYVLWYMYGALIHDPFVKVPNIIGASLYGFQLSLFAVYNSPSTIKLTEKR